MSNHPDYILPEKNNRIHIGFSDHLNIEVESNELSFQDLKKEALSLVETIKIDKIEIETKSK